MSQGIERINLFRTLLRSVRTKPDNLFQSLVNIFLFETIDQYLSENDSISFTRSYKDSGSKKKPMIPYLSYK